MGKNRFEGMNMLRSAVLRSEAGSDSWHHFPLEVGVAVVTIGQGIDVVIVSQESTIAQSKPTSFLGHARISDQLSSSKIEASFTKR